MIAPLRRARPLLGVLAFSLTLLLLRYTLRRPSWREMPQVVGLGDLIPDSLDPSTNTGNEFPGWDASPIFTPGYAKPPGSNYTRWLVMARTKDENVSWVDEEKLDVVKKIYVADDPRAPLHPPKNKGHEAMIYLTYIIDHYNALPDVTLFMHAHRFSWHNNDMLNNDGAEMIRRLSSERVLREGYMNMRCHWLPGCPDWMHPGKIDEDSEKHEEMLMAKAWSELFPGRSIPHVLGSSCCAQLALSRDRIRAIPLAKYVFYRDWLFRTDIRDSISGRIWEYLWHVVFTGETVFCPDQHACYCDGYGVCFDGSAGFEKWFQVRWKKRDTEKELAELIEGNGKGNGESGNAIGSEQKEAELKAKIKDMEKEMDERRDVALERGRDPRNRAKEAGRVWRDGDGF